MTEGLTVDGIVGPDTWTALITGKTVQNGGVGDAVRAAQSLLVNKFGAGIAVDGTFGQPTPRMPWKASKRTSSCSSMALLVLKPGRH